MQTQSWEIVEIAAREIRTCDDLFGAGVVHYASVGLKSVEVRVTGATLTFDPDEIVTVRRG